MPLIENDVTFAFLNSLDPKFKSTDRIFNKIRSGMFAFAVAAVGFLLWQIELNMKAK